MRKNEKICCFTGHRYIPLRDFTRIVAQTKTEVEKLMLSGISGFMSGGALGYDMACSLIILELKEKYPQIKLELAIPCKNQTKLWNRVDIERYTYILEKADRVIYTTDIYYTGCMQTRNRYMVDNSDFIIAYCIKYNGGAKYTLDYARTRGIHIIRVF